MNTNRDVILVDLSNIRDQTGEKARTARGLVPAFSRSYLDGFEDSLRTLAPYAHIVFIAGRAIVSKDLWIEGGKRQSTDFKWMKHRTKSKGESDFVYLMQEQMDGEEHIKADELILHLAHQLNGFVISNDNYNDLDGLASLIQSCDFVITTSNVTAHLAGALGKKTFVLVNPEQLWYWHNENVSSWYPSVNIFQKKISEDWGPAIERMSFSVLNYLKGIENG